MRAALVLILGLLASPAVAGPVTLKVNPVDHDGRVTLGDVFDGAGSAADVVVSNRAGPSVVFEAGQLQALASRAGLSWSNPQGLRRVIVREAALAPAPDGAPAAAMTEAAAAVPTAGPPRPVAARALAGPRVIARNDAVEVAYVAGGVTLTVRGRATRDAAVGQAVSVLNAASGRTIEAVATGPGRAVTGPEAQVLRAPSPSA